jgi:ATP-dependent RNA helicase RhlE
MSFQELGLSSEILKAVADEGYDTPTPIQSKAIPVILEGKDILAGAQTGTGKTAGFTLPMLQRLNENAAPGHKKTRPVRALILAPTRELAAQVHDSVRTYGKYLKLRSAVIYGGVSINPQYAALRRGVDILVATPGRLLDHCRQGTVNLSHVEMLVLDEADRMLDMGFIHDIKEVINMVPAHKQSLLFSATFSNEIKKLSNSLLNNPELIEVARNNTASDRVNQMVHMVDRDKKRDLLSYLIGSKNWDQVLVFTRTKNGADRLSKQLDKDGIRSDAIHGDKSQGARKKALSNFKRGTVRVLVATDIAARGIDIDNLSCVINYEMPNNAEDYVHRIGRTGRAGNEGEAISLVCVDERGLLKNVERLIRKEVTKEIIPGYEPDPSIKPEPIPGSKKRSGGRNYSRSRGSFGGSGNGNRDRNGEGKRYSRGGENGGQKRQGRYGKSSGRNSRSSGSSQHY